MAVRYTLCILLLALIRREVSAVAVDLFAQADTATRTLTDTDTGEHHLDSPCPIESLESGLSGDPEDTVCLHYHGNWFGTCLFRSVNRS